MRLEISNFAKIGNADLKFNGITVIAGENNTGKTTVGKILFCVFNSLCDLERQIDRRIESEIRKLCSRYLRNIVFMSHRITKIEVGTYSIPRTSEEICASIAEEICKIYPKEFSFQLLKKLIMKYFEDYKLVYREDADEDINELYTALVNVINYDREKVMNEMIYQFFDLNFSSQIHSLTNGSDLTKIKLLVKNNPISISFSTDFLELQGNVNIMHEAYLLDDPFVIDSLQAQRYTGVRNANRPRDFLVNKISSYDDQPGSVFDTINAKEKIADIMKIISTIVPGEITTKGGRWTLTSKYFDTPVDFNNLSAGLKSFVLLKMLLGKGILKEKDILILDEPEIHLHPDWQIKYAELIVLLQKKFDLSIVVTTHSRDFLEAIDLYSRKYNISDNCNYYLAQQTSGISTFNDVTDDLTLIYRQLISPSRLLDKLRFELEDE